MLSRSLLLGGVCILGLPSGNLHGQSITLDLRSTTPDSGYVGNCIHLDGECVSLTVSAWSSADSGRGREKFAEAALGQWSTGLGVLNQNELNRQTQYDHQLDNVRGADFVLFLFDKPIRLLDLTVDPYGSWDTDVMYWSGTIDPLIDLAGASMEDLPQTGLQSTIDVGSPGSTPRTIIFSEHAFVNALLVGVPPDSNAPDRQKDGFKIQQMNVACAMPEPSSLGLLLVGTAVLLLRRREPT